MASIDITFTHPAASFSKTVTVPDAHLARFVQALRAQTGQQSETNAQVLENFVNDWLRQMRGITQAVEARAAAQAAEAGVAEIDMT